MGTGGRNGTLGTDGLGDGRDAAPRAGSDGRAEWAGELARELARELTARELWCTSRWRSNEEGRFGNGDFAATAGLEALEDEDGRVKPMFTIELLATAAFGNGNLGTQLCTLLVAAAFANELLLFPTDFATALFAFGALVAFGGP